MKFSLYTTNPAFHAWLFVLWHSDNLTRRYLTLSKRYTELALLCTREEL